MPIKRFFHLFLAVCILMHTLAPQIAQATKKPLLEESASSSSSSYSSIEASQYPKPNESSSAIVHVNFNDDEDKR
ncbi:MAG: hypothetical protein ABFQ95_05200, partial [Pseudomonadota bacterium]